MSSLPSFVLMSSGIYRCLLSLLLDYLLVVLNRPPYRSAVYPFGVYGLVPRPQLFGHLIDRTGLGVSFSLPDRPLPG